MTGKTVVNLALTFDGDHVVALAADLQRRLKPDQFRVLVELAAELVARWETVAQGSRVLVVPMVDVPTELARAVKAAGLPVPE